TPPPAWPWPDPRPGLPRQPDQGRRGRRRLNLNLMLGHPEETALRYGGLRPPTRAIDGAMLCLLGTHVGLPSAPHTRRRLVPDGRDPPPSPLPGRGGQRAAIARRPGLRQAALPLRFPGRRRPAGSSPFPVVAAAR